MFFFRLVFFLTCFLLSHYSDAQNRLWTPISSTLLPADNALLLNDFQLFELDTAIILSSLNQPKKQFYRKEKIVLSLPFFQKKMEQFYLDLSPILPEKLSQKFPTVQSFVISAKNAPMTTGRITWTPSGFYGHITKNGHSFFIEKLPQIKDQNIYIAYEETDLILTNDSPLTCGNRLLKPIKTKNPSLYKKQKINTELKVSRLAITLTEQFTNAVGGTVDLGLSAILNSLTSLNVIFERDVGIRFMLHEANDRLIFTDENPAPFSDVESAFGLWEEHANLLDSLLGNDTYDIGHIFASECTGGVAGLATLASVCSPRKANGVSCIFSGNTGEFRKTLYHEIGHQLGANHTWSNCGQRVNDDQRHPPTAVEPGSGSTVMSYGGVCGNFNIVATSQDNLHGVSILEIKNTLSRDTFDCFQLIPLENTPPMVTVRADSFFIPISTPFELNALAIDVEDQNRLTYSWEQLDTGTVSQIGSPIGNAPSFRVFPPTEDSNRTFPRTTDIILNKSSNAEVLPDTARTLTFGVTVRDNHPEGGSTTFEKVTFFASELAGPFVVLQPDTANISYEEGDSIEVNWEVANTDLPPINCTEVNIYLSYNNGQAFTELLAEGIPNKGNTKVLLPDTTSNRARIKVKCSDNIFFDMSNNRFKITEKIISSTKNIYQKPIELYPNPTTDQLTVAFETIPRAAVELLIFDAYGRNMFIESFKYKKEVFQINTKTFPNGVYFLKGFIGEQIFSKRFIIQR